MRPEGLGQWKILMTPSGIEPATFQLVVQCINQLVLGFRVILRINSNKEVTFKYRCSAFSMWQDVKAGKFLGWPSGLQLFVNLKVLASSTAARGSSPTRTFAIHYTLSRPTGHTQPVEGTVDFFYSPNNPNDHLIWTRYHCVTTMLPLC